MPHLSEKANSLRRWMNLSHSDPSAGMTKRQAEIIESEIRRHLALYQLSENSEVRIYHLLAADALCSAIEDPMKILSE